jgi:hypothetical protein
MQNARHPERIEMLVILSNPKKTCHPERRKNACHPERSAAKSKDLLLLLPLQCFEGYGDLK